MWSIWSGTRSTEPISSSATVTAAARESEFHKMSLTCRTSQAERVRVRAHGQVVPEDAAVFSVSAVVP